MLRSLAFALVKKLFHLVFYPQRFKSSFSVHLFTLRPTLGNSLLQAMKDIYLEPSDLGSLLAIG